MAAPEPLESAPEAARHEAHVAKLVEERNAWETARNTQLDRALAAERERDQLSAELAACKDEAGKAYGCHQTLLSEAHQTVEQLRAELQSTQERLKGTLALADERAADKARVEHELLAVQRAHASSESDRLDYLRLLERERERHGVLHEQYEALRAIVEVHDSDRRPSKTFGGTVVDTISYYGRVMAELNALLRPATPEPSGNHMDRAEWAGLDESRALPEPLSEEQRKAALEAMRKDRLSREDLWGEVDRLKRALRLLLGGVATNKPSGDLIGSQLESAAHDAWQILVVDALDARKAVDRG